jgi:hypothetical protein
MAAIEAEVEHERKVASAVRDQMDLRMVASLLKSIDDKLIARADLGATLQTMLTFLQRDLYAIRKTLWATNILLALIAFLLWK